MRINIIGTREVHSAENEHQFSMQLYTCTSNSSEKTEKIPKRISIAESFLMKVYHFMVASKWAVFWRCLMDSIRLTQL